MLGGYILMQEKLQQTLSESRRYWSQSNNMLQASFNELNDNYKHMQKQMKRQGGIINYAIQNR